MQYERLAFYVRIVQTLAKLKRVTHGVRIEGPSDGDNVLALLNQLQNLLQDQTDSVDRARCQPFPRLRDLRPKLEKFESELIAGLPEDDEAAARVTLGRSRHKRLQELLAEFEQIFDEEVGQRQIFISPERDELMVFLRFEERLQNPDSEYFNHLPRLAKQNFKDAGRCLVYGLPGAAIPMALQAVEATLRFYYRRHGLPAFTNRGVGGDWGQMVRTLHDANLLPGGGYKERLDSLRSQYRNAVAHARAYFEVGKPQAGLHEGERILRECWEAARILMAEIRTRRQLVLEMVGSPSLSFDSAVAVYLYKWNPELPYSAFEYGPTIDKDTIVDKTMWDMNSTHWPQTMSATNDKSLSRTVLECFHMQPNYESVLSPLLKFVDDCRQDGAIEAWEGQGVTKRTANLYHLFLGICVQKNYDPGKVMDEFITMLDTLFEKSLDPQVLDLVNMLERQLAYQAYCERPNGPS
jgi:hypothetical protein